jgi:hypothetical protein
MGNIKRVVVKVEGRYTQYSPLIVMSTQHHVLLLSAVCQSSRLPLTRIFVRWRGLRAQLHKIAILR